MIRFLFKQPQPKRFEFKPRYYNAMREELKAREEAIKRELDLEKSDYSDAALRNRMQHTWKRPSRQEANRSSNFTVLILAGLLGIFAFFFLR